MIDFPATPTLNQLFTASNGATYQWNGTVWVPVGVGGSTISVGDTPPGSPVIGQLWWNSTLGSLFIWYDDGTSQQWVPANPVPTPAISAAFGVRTTTNVNLTGPGSANLFRAAATPVEDHDTGSVWDNTAGEFIAPLAGLFQFNLSAHADPSTGTAYCGFVISHLTSANVVIRNYACPQVRNTNGVCSTSTLSQMLKMNAGEKVRFMIASTAAATFTQHAEDTALLTGGSTLTFASGYQVT